MDDPIFIVGFARSGTTLLAAMLGAHSRIACGPESQILSQLRRRKLKEIFSDHNWPSKGVKALRNIRIPNESIIDSFGLSDSRVELVLKKNKPSIASLFDAITGEYARIEGKPRWLEKTPRHLLFVKTIRKEFPQSKIIRIVRDPRDAALSRKNMPWASNDFIENIYLWDEWYRHSNDFFEYDKNNLTVIYENLVKNPSKELSRVCHFIEEEFEPAMLDTNISGKSVASKSEYWKDQVSSPIDINRSGRWKSELSNHEAQWAYLICENWINAFQYEKSNSTMQVIPVSGLDANNVHVMLDWLYREAEEGRVYKEVIKESHCSPMVEVLGRETANNLTKYIQFIYCLLVKKIRRNKVSLIVAHKNDFSVVKIKILNWLSSDVVYAS